MDDIWYVWSLWIKKSDETWHTGTAWDQDSDAVQVRSRLLWNVTVWLGAGYWCFRTAYQIHLQGSVSLTHSSMVLYGEVWTPEPLKTELTGLFWNVGNWPPTYAAYNPRRAKTSQSLWQMHNTSKVLVLRHWGWGVHLNSQYLDRDLKWAPLNANWMCYHWATAQEATQNSFWIDNYEILKNQLYNEQHLMCSLS